MPAQEILVCEHAFEVLFGADAVSLTTDYDRVDDRAAFARFWMADEQPVLLAQCGWTDRVFDQVVVDLKVASLAIDHGFVPNPESVVAGLSSQAFG